MAVEVLVTGGDTELGRTVAEGFRDDGHKVTLVGARRSDLEIAAKELDVDAIVCDTTDPASLEEARGLFPHHLDTIVNVPAPTWDAGDPRTRTLEKITKQVLEDEPLIYLYHAKVLIAHSTKLEGYKQMPDGLIRVMGLKLK